MGPLGGLLHRPLRALFDEMRRQRDVRRAVLALDMAAAAELVSISRLWGECATRPRWDGVPVVRRALHLADESSRSPGESWLRLAWQLDARRPRPLTNREVFDEDGRLLGVADLLDPAAGVVGEYDGGEHARPGRRSRDAARDTAFRDAGLEVFRVTGSDVHHPEVVVARIHSAYDRAERAGHRRGWTLDRPAGWPREVSLDDHLDTQEVLRDLHRGPLSSTRS